MGLCFRFVTVQPVFSSHLAYDLSPTRLLGPLAGSMAVPLALPQASGVVG